MEGKKQELRKYAGLALNQLTTKYPNRDFNLSHNIMAQTLPGITTDLTCQSWTALSYLTLWPWPTPKKLRGQLFPYMAKVLPRSR